MKDEITYKIGQRLYYPFVDEQGHFHFVETRIVAVEQERMSIYSYVYSIYVFGRLYRVHADDLFDSVEDFCDELYYMVVNL